MNEIPALKMVPSTITYEAEKQADYRYWQEYTAILKNMSLCEMHLLRVATDKGDKEAIYNLFVGKFIYNRANRGGT